VGKIPVLARIVRHCLEKIRKIHFGLSTPMINYPDHNSC